MKPGRLKTATLNSILRSVGITTDESSTNLAAALPPSVKYYIPTHANSPLYGLNPRLAMASAAMAQASNQDEPLETPGVGSASSPTQTLSPETAVAIQAMSATRSTSSRNMEARGTRWASFIDDQSTERSESPTSDDLVQHRRTRSLPNNRDIGENIGHIQHSSERHRLVSRIPEGGSTDVRSATTTTSPSRLSLRRGSSTDASQSLECITIPILPAIPEMGTGSRVFSSPTSTLAEPEPAKEDDRAAWLKDLDHITIDWSMRSMDSIFSASFYSFIRDEKNVDLSSVRLARIIKDFKPRQVALALRWLTQGWSVENTSRLMRNIFLDWLPDLAACVFALTSKDWPVRPQLSLCTAYVLLTEPPGVAGIFLRTLTMGWARDDAIELVSYLDGLLEWDEGYFHELMSVFSDGVGTRDTSRAGSTMLRGGKEYLDDVFQYLSHLYSRNGGRESEKETGNDEAEMEQEPKPVLDSSNLPLIAHFINCPTCQNHEHCEVARMLYRSQSISDGLASSPSLRSRLELVERAAQSEPALSSRRVRFDDTDEEGLGKGFDVEDDEEGKSTSSPGLASAPLFGSPRNGDTRYSSEGSRTSDIDGGDSE